MKTKNKTSQTTVPAIAVEPVLAGRNLLSHKITYKHIIKWKI